ncbi:MAG: CTP synthase (glutamine hydrolyzing) [Euryarchaeota archaeon]|nr:CTP synthase (glutamine hydrolyzing) [Euryarchaeota archaeon]
MADGTSSFSPRPDRYGAGPRPVIPQRRRSRSGPRYVVVTGGVLSGLGKGITTSSIGRLFKCHGLSVTAVKIDPYLNIDAGTMNPFEHGEVYVLPDGGEVDLDLGNYERFLDIDLGRDNNITTGKAYMTVIEKERRGDYLGKTVQIVPHVVTEVREWIQRVANESQADVCLVEVGGTVGDIESMPFLEAVRQLHTVEGDDNVVFIHTTLVPKLGAVGEQKTKPTQHSVRDLKAAGVEPDILVCRASEPIEDSIKEKLSTFTGIPAGAVISAHDVDSIYEVPLLFDEQGLTDYLLGRLNLPRGDPVKALAPWRDFVRRVTDPKHAVTIGIVGKYTHLADSYLSITESFRHAGAASDTAVSIEWLNAEEINQGTPSALEAMGKVDGILIPGGFGARGAEGKIKAATYARENNVPLLGICYGFQLAIVEYARNVLGLKKADTTENTPDTPDPVICILPEQMAVTEMGGTMRLGASRIAVRPGTMAHRLYGSDIAVERHRHRYEMNPEYVERMEKAGLVYSGRMADRADNIPIMEIMELPDHPFYIGGQFHPEFTSRPGRPNPLFLGFIEAARDRMLGVKHPKNVESRPAEGAGVVEKTT